LGGVAARVAAGIVVTAVVVGGAWVAGTLSGDDPIPPASGVPAEPRNQETRESAAAAEGSAVTEEGGLASRVGWVVVQVTNHANRALSVRRAEDVSAHESGERPIYLCNFLHGGRCSDYCVTTPNGNVVCGKDVLASLSEISRHPSGDDGKTEAWRSLCSQVSDVFAPPLAEGWMGVQGGANVTIDWANFIFTARPCVFAAG
jgi:hypothetical protein